MKNESERAKLKERNARVAAHIRNTPGLWSNLESMLERCGTRTAAAREFVEWMQKSRDEPATPEGERYTQQAVVLASHASEVIIGVRLSLPSPWDPKVRGKTWTTAGR